MFLLRRVLVIWICLLAANAACAFTFSYGRFFDVEDVKYENDVLKMPLAQGKYKNVKILSQKVYRFLLDCEKDCQYQVPAITFETVDYRKAFTQEGMLIADVDFNGEIALTFLVFKNKKGFLIKTPKEIIFKDKKLQKQVEIYLKELAEKTYEVCGGKYMGNSGKCGNGQYVF
ncbi:MAG: hypothetical protein IKL48_06045 [Elusimicrobiaceae bacterium]|nr:hypothetical protein [Elusimicrobiaceae bacterium]